MASNKLIHFFIRVLLCLQVISLSGCYEEEEQQSIDFFSVSGVISDKNSGEPVPGVTINLSAYSVEDQSRTDKLFSSKYQSSSKGEYQFFVNLSYDLSNVYFVFEVVDEDNGRAVRYLPSEMVIFMSRSSKLFNTTTGAYELKGNDFSLYPAEG